MMRCPGPSLNQMVASFVSAKCLGEVYIWMDMWIRFLAISFFLDVSDVSFQISIQRPRSQIDKDHEVFEEITLMDLRQRYEGTDSGRTSMFPAILQFLFH